MVFYLSGYYLLPEGFMRGSLYSAIGSFVASPISFWGEFGLTLLFNLGIVVVVISHNEEVSQNYCDSFNSLYSESFYSCCRSPEKNFTPCIGIHLYGRRLYETMAPSWPTADEDPTAPEIVIEYARIWKGIKKIVFSKMLKRLAGILNWSARISPKRSTN